jgi:hypothetical protein
MYFSLILSYNNNNNNYYYYYYCDTNITCLNLKKKIHNAHETKICCNPPIHSFTGDRKNLTDPQQTNT